MFFLDLDYGNRKKIELPTSERPLSLLNLTLEFLYLHIKFIHCETSFIRFDPLTFMNARMSRGLAT